jgi:hypothetical protein
MIGQGGHVTPRQRGKQASHQLPKEREAGTGHGRARCRRCQCTTTPRSSTRRGEARRAEQVSSSTLLTTPSRGGRGTRRAAAALPDGNATRGGRAGQVVAASAAWRRVGRRLLPGDTGRGRRPARGRGGRE